MIYGLRNKDTLANKVLNSLSEKGQIIRKYYQRRLPSDTSKDYYYIIRDTPNAETIIVEYGFLDNIADAKRLKENYKDYAEAVVEAVLDYKGINYEKSGYYTVKKGDSLWSIASTYSTSVSELKKLNNLSNNTLTIGQKLKLPTSTIGTDNDIIQSSNSYTVKSGDSLYQIAKKYDITVDDLKSTNNLKTNTISIGQILKIPGLSITTPDTYTVTKGDSLYLISKKYGISISDLKDLNNLTNDTLSIGQILLLPGIVEESTTSSYTVKSGDTLYSIANKYNISVDKLKYLNNLTSNTLSIGQTLKVREISSEIITDDYDYYTIKEGDTLYSLAQKYDTTIEELKKLNNLTSNTLSKGFLLKIPNIEIKTYSVKKGDSLWSIAKEYNTNVNILKEINNLTSNTLSIGQQLLIP